MRRYHRWTEEQEEMLRQLFHAGADVEEMANVLNRKMTNIRARLYALGLKLSDRTIEPDIAEFGRVMELHTGRAPE